MVGGPFYEPILAGIPSYDRVGQISAYSRYLEQLFGAKVRGMWMPERVWEQNFASDVTRAGIEYTILDDHHFRSAGLRDDQLYGYYLSEDEGRLLKIFPGSEKLRYTIPLAEPEETIRYLREIVDERPRRRSSASATTAKNSAPGRGPRSTSTRTAGSSDFSTRFAENAEWLKICTSGEAVDHVPPVGSVYLPDCSYREMTEWALPAERLAEFETDRQAQSSTIPSGTPLRPYIRGGTWRNFRIEISRSQRDVHPHAADQPAAAANHLRRRRRRAAPLHQRGAERALSRTVQLLLLARRPLADSICPTSGTPSITT